MQQRILNYLFKRSFPRQLIHVVVQQLKRVIYLESLEVPQFMLCVVLHVVASSLRVVHHNSTTTAVNNTQNPSKIG